jgi:GAF domain-containing protein
VVANAADSRVRWPVFAPQASGVGFRVICAVPLRVRTDVIGALNLFRGSDEPFTGAEMELAQAMAEMAAIGLIQERALRGRPYVLLAVFPHRQARHEFTDNRVLGRVSAFWPSLTIRSCTEPPESSQTGTFWRWLA